MTKVELEQAIEKLKTHANDLSTKLAGAQGTIANLEVQVEDAKERQVADEEVLAIGRCVEAIDAWIQPTRSTGYPLSFTTAQPVPSWMVQTQFTPVERLLRALADRYGIDLHTRCGTLEETRTPTIAEAMNAMEDAMRLERGL